MEFKITPERVQHLINSGNFSGKDLEDLQQMKKRLEEKDDLTEFTHPKYENVLKGIVDFLTTGKHEYNGKYDVKKIKKNLLNKI